MKKILTFVLVLLVFLTAACSKNEETKQTVDEKPTPTEEQPKEEEPTFKHQFPLTGVVTNDEVNQRPVAVMVNNDPNARPQSGLYMADVVYEILAEGDVTRFLAVFQSEKPEIIGPVRSSRDYYIDLSKGFDALYVAHGWSETARVRLQRGEVDNLNGMEYDGTLFWRANHAKAPHNSYTSFENIQKGAADKKYEMTADVKPYQYLTEEELPQVSGTPATDIKVSYSSRQIFMVEYKYVNGKYERYNGGVQTIDREAEKPVLLDNILILEMNHQTIDDYGRREVDITTGGKGLLLQQGKSQEIEWKNIDNRIVPMKDGKEIGLVPGKTWINIIPTTPGIAGAVSFGE